MIDPNEPTTKMTIRTHLAAMAMRGLLGQHESLECESGARDIEPYYKITNHERLVREAVRCADLLIAELNKAKEE